LQPVKFEVAEKTTVWWCQCKKTKTPPVCDGSHKNVWMPPKEE
jgi:CDGSH-type Zn-finger protein